MSDHIETLEELDIEYKELAHKSGISNWRRVSALNTEPDFIQCMATVVVRMQTFCIVRHQFVCVVDYEQKEARSKPAVALRDAIVDLHW